MNPISANEISDQLFVEFGNFISSYEQSKRFYKQGYQLDAYTYILNALNHWAKIVILENGLVISDSVWEQVSQINLGVFKLYEEVTSSKETIEQKIQLVLLACEFSVVSKLEKCCQSLISFLRSKGEPLTLLQLGSHFVNVSPHLSMIVKLLLKKNLIREVMTTSNVDDLSIGYTVDGCMPNNRLEFIK